MRRLTALTGAAAGAAIAVTSMSAGGAAAPHRSAGATQPAASSLHGWHKVGGSAMAVSSIGLGRFHGNLVAAWRGESGGNDTLTTGSVTSKGGVAASAQRLATWSAINDFPQVISLNGALDVVFSGLRTTNPGETYDGRAEYAYTSTDGKSFTLSGDQLTGTTTGVYGSNGTDAVSTGGNPVVVYAPESADQLSYHEGTQPLTEATSPDPTTVHTGGSVLYAGDGADAKTGHVWAIWNSESSSSSQAGISAQPIVPAGGRVHAPGKTSIIDSQQRIDVAARSGGGLYASYALGGSEANKVALWKLGASSAIVRNAGSTVQVTDVAAGTHGRVWVFWADANSSSVHAARTNKSATALGATCTVTTPDKTTGVWSLAGDGTEGGPLQLFVNAGSNQNVTSIYTQNVKPCLTVKLKPGHVKPGHSVTVKVRDAGSPVRHAHVSLFGEHEKTNRHGKAVFTVPDNAGGHHKVTVKKRGYHKAARTVHVS